MFIRWRDKDTGVAWFVRELSVNGQFFGDITDSVRKLQRNFQGEFDRSTLARVFELSNTVTSTLGSNIVENDSNYIVAIGHDLKNIDYQGNWRYLGEVPEQLINLIRLFNSGISKSLKLRPSEDQNDWIIALAKI